MTWTDEYNELTGESKLRLVLNLFVKGIGYIPRLCTTCLVPTLSKAQGFIAGIYCPLLYNILLPVLCVIRSECWTSTTNLMHRGEEGKES